MTPIEQNIINSLQFLSKEAKKEARNILGIDEDCVQDNKLDKNERFKHVSIRTKYT